MTQTVLILGSSGKFGSHCASEFASAGWTVHRWKRSTDMNRAAAKADLILNGLNPPDYNDWETSIPRITSQVITAARSSGATVLLPGNVYNFGQSDGPWSERTKQEAHTRKGKIRIVMEDTYRESGVPTIVLRAGDFIDPDCNGSIMDLAFLRHLKRGKIMRLGRSDIRHAYCYVPDLARAAVEIATIRGTLSNFADIPFPGHTFRMQEFKDTLESYLERPLKFSSFPWWFLNIARPFWRFAGEMREMRYLWDLEHELSPDTFQALLPNFKMTSMKTVMTCQLHSGDAN